MKRNILAFLLALLGMNFGSCQSADHTVPTLPTNNKPAIEDLTAEPYAWETNRTEILTSTDMVLIYGGGHHRTPYAWSKDRLTPYVNYVDKDGKPHWLFDSFLFLEIMDKGEGGANKMFAKGYFLEAANQADWEKLIDYYFQSETGIGALDASIKEASATVGTPARKRQVIISIPEPIVYQHPEDVSSSTRYWGKVDGKTLDFSNSSDRIKACKWYIDRVRAKFDEKKFQNVELGGFYWLAEKATDTRDILETVANYLNKLKYSFNWIPYYGADGYNQWKSFGFNYAYFQPNYFWFNRKGEYAQTPEERLDDACSKALQYDMHVELEFDDDALASRGYGYRLQNYMNKFKEYGFWKEKRMAYYQGNNSLLTLKNSSNAADQALFHEFCQFVISRPIRDSH